MPQDVRDSKEARHLQRRKTASGNRKHEGKVVSPTGVKSVGEF